jgi:osmotically-inducible protein OsmY
VSYGIVMQGSEGELSGILDIERVRELTMREVPLLLTLTAVLTASAASQEIVIEPTNGRAQTTNHVTRPAAVDSTPVERNSSAKSARTSLKQQHPSPAKKASEKQLAMSKKSVPMGTKPSASPAVESMSKPTDSAPAPKKLPERPTWAMADTRDVHSVQMEIAGALARDPKLSGSSIEVSVDDGSVLLQGRAGTEERIQAVRLAQSYAWNRKVVDRIAVVPPNPAQK